MPVFRRPYTGVAIPPPDVHALLTGLALHERHAHTVVVANSYARASELLRAGGLTGRVNARQMINWWSVSTDRTHLELVEEGEGVYLCKHTPETGVRDDYVKVWPK